MRLVGIEFTRSDLEAFQGAFSEGPVGSMVAGVCNGMLKDHRRRLQSTAATIEEIRVSQGVVMAFAWLEEAVDLLLKADADALERAEDMENEGERDTESEEEGDDAPIFMG